MVEVYVPRPGSKLREEIWPGSGIVGSRVEGTGRLRLDYEGDQEVFPSFEDRVRRAAERHTWEGAGGQRYSTRACAYADPADVLRVGHYDRERQELTVERTDLLQEWLEES